MLSQSELRLLMEDVLWLNVDARQMGATDGIRV